MSNEKADVPAATVVQDGKLGGDTPKTAAPAPRQPYKRKLSNFMLDKKLQLRYVLLVTVLSAMISGSLGYLIYHQRHAASASIDSDLAALTQTDSSFSDVKTQVAEDNAHDDRMLVYKMAGVGIGLVLILSAYLLESRARHRSALALLAYAVLVKEVAALALLPWLWRALRGHDLRRMAGVAGALVPYATWSVWLRWRVGEFPFLAHTMSRSAALSLPGVGIHDVIAAKTPNYQPILVMVLVTIVLGLVGAWQARRFPIAGLAAAYAFLTACLGPNALRFVAETMRVLALPQVVALLCIVLAVTGPRDIEIHALSAPNPDL